MCGLSSVRTHPLTPSLYDVHLTSKSNYIVREGEVKDNFIRSTVINLRFPSLRRGGSIVLNVEKKRGVRGES